MVWSYLGELSLVRSQSSDLILHIEWRTLQNYRPVFPCERLSVGQHGELVDDGRVQELHVVRPRLDPAESVESIIIISYVSLSEDDDDDDGVSVI